MNSYGLPEYINVIEVSPNNSKTEIENALKELVIENKNVDAIIFSTNLLSVQGLLCINENKIRIPENLGFIGFDGGDCFDLYDSPLTYIKQLIQEMAKEAFKILMDFLVTIKHLRSHKLFLNRV